jgi:hypothetical protein
MAARSGGVMNSVQHAVLDSLRSIPTILGKAGMFQALVKAVRLFELGEANRMGPVPTALE